MRVERYAGEMTLRRGIDGDVTAWIRAGLPLLWRYQVAQPFSEDSYIGRREMHAVDFDSMFRTSTSSPLATSMSAKGPSVQKIENRSGHGQITKHAQRNKLAMGDILDRSARSPFSTAALFVRHSRITQAGWLLRLGLGLLPELKGIRLWTAQKHVNSPASLLVL